MNIFAWIVLLLWSVFIVYWFVSSISAKKSIKTGNWWRGAAIRAALIIVVFLFLRNPIFDQIPTHASGGWRGIVGVILCAAGIAFAVWARVYLGRNWGMPMSLREGHELVTSGPYSFVRHPIYASFLSAIIGSVLVDGMVWLVILIVSGLYFIYSATVEEKMMIEQFPNEYPAYIKKTKMLIPFVL